MQVTTYISSKEINIIIAITMSTLLFAAYNFSLIVIEEVNQSHAEAESHRHWEAEHPSQQYPSISMCGGVFPNLPFRRLSILFLLFISFLAARIRKRAGLVLSITSLILVHTIYYNWFKEYVMYMRNVETPDLSEFPNTAYLFDANWIDVCVFGASLILLLGQLKICIRSLLLNVSTKIKGGF
jgi:hypothetical protein